VTAEWCSTTIDAACNIEYGTRVVQKRDGGSAFPVYGGGGATFFMDTANRESRVVVSRFGMSEECTRFVDGRFFLNDSGLTLSPKNVEALLPTFLDRLILSLDREIFSLGRGAAQKNLDVPAFKALRISYPSSIAEQRRIVAILDKAFEGIATAKAHAERNLRNAREVFAQSREDILERSEGWLEASLSELCEIRHGYAFGGEHFATHGEHVLLTPGSFFEAGGFRDRGGKTKYFVGAIPPAFVLDEGDLLVAMTEQAAGLLGSPLLVPEDGRYLHNQRLGRVIGRDSIPWTNDFFFHVFNLRRVRAEIHASASGVKVRHTSPAKIGAVRVKFPPASGAQSAVAAALRELAEDCQRLQALYTRKFAALDELKQSLLHQAFSGQL
jgi:type I restriction enzyme S subunit